MEEKNRQKAQFIHIESYSKKSINSAKKKNGKYQTEVKQKSINGVIGEAKRLKSYCKHVEVPKPPLKLFGSDLDDVLKETEHYYKNHTVTLKNGQKRAFRSNANCLIAGVVSVPADFKHWDEYKKDAIKWLKAKYGDNLRNVTEHTDEANPHFHFYCTLKVGQNLSDIHDGERALLRESEKNPTGSKKDRIVFYKEAMKKYQDDFFTEVSAKYGLARLSEAPRPRYNNLTTNEFLEQKKELEEIKKKLEDAQEIVKTFENKGYSVGLKKGIGVAVDDFKKNSFLGKIKFIRFFENEKLKEVDKELINVKSRKDLYSRNYWVINNKNEELKKENEKILNERRLLIIDNVKKTKKIENMQGQIYDFEYKIKKLESKNNSLEQENKDLSKKLDKYIRFKNEILDSFYDYCNLAKNKIFDALNRNFPELVKKSEPEPEKQPEQKQNYENEHNNKTKREKTIS